jgi:hypothetical protein
MTSEREARKARMTAAATRRARPEATLTGPTEIVRVKPIRITVDLSPDLYKRLNRWAKETALELELDRLPVAEVVRAFIRVLDDPTIESDVRDQIRSMQ